MIGKHYNYHEYNCAHFVAEWYKTKLGITIPTDGVFELSFAKWLRQNFTQIQAPVENALVLMNDVRFAHIGIYHNNCVRHNWKPARGKGSVVQTPLGIVQRNYKKVTYWQWSK
jgi:hypothetical protein